MTTYQTFDFGEVDNHLSQWSSLPVQAQGKSLPELRKACGPAGLLVITVEICGNNGVEYEFVSVRPLSLQLPRQCSLDVAVSML
jgi:hypothetical protein